jgi:hypothetical protein
VPAAGSTDQRAYALAIVHPIHYGAQDSPAVQTALQAARERGAAELEPPDLLLALMADPAVGAAIARCGVSTETIERAAAAWPRRTAKPGPDVVIAPATWLVLHRAEQAAFVREHVAIEPGHLLLGMLEDPGCGGARVLRDAGADLATLAAEIDRRLPGQTLDVAWHRAEAQRHPPLSGEAVQRLLEDLGEWHKAMRALRERRRAVAAGEAPRVADEDVAAVKHHAREHAAWVPLSDHHRHLAIAAADAHAPEHPFGFTYLVALGALTTACRKYDGPPQQADFLRTVRQRIDMALERTFREVARVRNSN